MKKEIKSKSVTSVQTGRYVDFIMDLDWTSIGPHVGVF